VASVREVPSFALLPGSPRLPLDPLLFASPAVAVGQVACAVFVEVAVDGMEIVSPRDHEEPVTAVRGADGLSGYAIPLRIVPDLGQRPENSGESPRTES